MLSGYLSYMDRELTGPKRWVRIASNIKDEALAHPIIATGAVAALTTVAATVYSAGAGIVNSINDSHDAAVARQVLTNLEKPSSPLATSSSWGIQREGLVMAGRIQYKNAKAGSPEATINQILMSSEAPGTGNGGCTTVDMRVKPEFHTFLQYVFSNSVNVTHNLSAAFNDGEKFYCKPTGVPVNLRSQLPSFKPSALQAIERNI